MANYYASARSNYFEVKDPEAFKAEMDDYGGFELIEEQKGFCFLFDEGIINDTYDEEKEDYVEIDWCDIFKRHLKKYQVVVFMEAGAEKLRYINGFAVAYSWTGEAVSIGLNNIYEMAQEEFGGDAKISLAQY